jgi:hypothetical protein
MKKKVEMTRGKSGELISAIDIIMEEMKGNIVRGNSFWEIGWKWGQSHQRGMVGSK